MAFIVQSLLQNRCHIGNEELIVGPFGFGNNWTKIRVGMRYSLAVPWQTPLQTYGNMPVATPSLGFGVCAGKLGWTNPNRILAIQGWPGNLTAATTGGVNYFGPSGNNYYTGYRTATAAATAVSTFGFQAFLPKTPSRANLLMDITKSYDAFATSLTLSVFMPSTTTIGSDQTLANFYELLHSAETTPTGYVAATPTVSGWGLSSDLLNALDCVAVNWWRSVPVVEVFNIGVIRFL